jgi:hypothetical protein
MQWCLISESLNYSQHSKGAHGYGGIWGGMKASFHHNLMAHHKSRVPRLGPGATSTPTNELCDVRNNVYYNYNGEGCYGAEAMHVNLVNNYYKLGPAGSSLSSAKKGRIIAIDKKIDNSFPAIDQIWGTFYIAGNVVEGQPNATADNWTGVQFNSKYGVVSPEDRAAMRLSEPLATDVVTTHSAEQAYEQVLKYAGCSLVRDAIDNRIIDEALSNTATFKGVQSNLPGIIDSQQDLKPEGAGADWSPWPDLAAGTSPTDSNNDGIPDGWLETRFPGKTSTECDDDGYSYLEVYLNEIVSEITEKQNQGGNVLAFHPIRKNEERISCYVNTLSKTLTVRCKETIGQLDIFSTDGKKVYSLASSGREETIRLASLPSGIYIVKTVSGADAIASAVKIRW